ncbi:MAG: phosphatase PAP2 family protein [Niastella sp.]|nr:phosphatase PAP2 family protein [Niastella sp.]
MKKATLIILIFMGGFVSAQQAIHLQNSNDSMVSQQNYLPLASENKIEKKHPYIKPFIIPAVFITYGFISIGHNSIHQINISTKNELREDHLHFKTKIDNYLQYSPAAAVYALNIAGVKGKNNFRDRTFIYAISTVFSGIAALSLKSITKVERPDGSGNNSFPSGHTTTAFAAASFLQHEYKDVSPWYGIAGYTVATGIGILRLYNNKHWIGDVVAGAGVGILSTKFAYAVYPCIKKKLFKNKSSNTVLIPYYQQHTGGISMLYQFK